MSPVNVVLVHGWGVNSAVWHGLLNEHVKCNPIYSNIVFHPIDIAGYGQQITKDCPADLSSLAKQCLQQAPEQAIWVGWSLGGMIAMQAAIEDAESRVLGLQLLNSTPKFAQADDWDEGVDLSVFQTFCDALANDYTRTLNTFLLLQAGSNVGARKLAKQVAQAINVYPQPSHQTLQRGIDCLASSDLRAQLHNIVIPTQVICGTLDRVTSPQASHYLAHQLQADLVEFKAGHAPFLNQPENYLKALLKLIDVVREAV